MTENEPTATFGEVVMVLREWAQAIRGDWSSIDGRSCCLELNNIADVLLASAHQAGAQVTARRLRLDAGVCLEGAGHWLSYCADGRDCSTEAENRYADRSPVSRKDGETPMAADLRTGWVALVGQIVGNLADWETVYSWDGNYYAAKERALRAGFDLAESDDFNVGYVDKGTLTWFGWFEEQHPTEDYPAVAEQFGWAS